MARRKLGSSHAAASGEGDVDEQGNSGDDPPSPGFEAARALARELELLNAENQAHTQRAATRLQGVRSAARGGALTAMPADAVPVISLGSDETPVVRWSPLQRDRPQPEPGTLFGLMGDLVYQSNYDDADAVDAHDDDVGDVDVQNAALPQDRP